MKEGEKMLRFGLFFFICCHWAQMALAWMAPWAPKMEASALDVKPFSSETIGAFLSLIDTHLVETESYAKYCQGAKLDLNGDEIDDYVFILPWMGNGLSAQGYTAHFILSSGEKGRMETVIEGYEINLSDLVQVNGKIYFRHSNFFNDFEKSAHNHWVYQVFTFNKDGTMKLANKDFASVFPAATIYYNNPKFKRVPLTDKDLKTIASKTMVISRQYLPAQRHLWREED
jgi:hypothetical protein